MNLKKKIETEMKNEKERRKETEKRGGGRN
jgi:hypothetical protein